MTRPAKIVLSVFVLVLLLGGGFFAYIWFGAGSGEASEAAEAETVAPAEPDSIVYAAVSGESEARFVIEEVLRGQPNTVIGRTNEVDGSIAIQFDPGAVDIGEFVINVRTIATDDEVRDRTIRTLILESAQDEYEFSTFRPTSVSGVPQSIEVGDTLNLAVTGDLTVRDVTQAVTFDMELVVISENRVLGRASSTITWDQFDITIPYVGGDSIVASVDDELRLELELLGQRES